MEPTNDFLDNLAAKQHEKLLREVIGDDKNDKKEENVEDFDCIRCNLTEDVW